MARRKAIPTEQTAAPVAQMKKVRRIEDYSEPIKEETAQATITIPIAAPPVEDDSYFDAIEDSLDELESEEIIIMRVERLPDFRKTGKYGRGTLKEYCGQIPFTPNFREDIQRAYGSGDYLIFLLDSSLHFLKGRKNRYTICIAEAAAPETVMANGRVIAQPVAASVTQKTFIEQLDEYAKISKSLALIANPTGQSQALVTTNNAPPVVPIEEKVTALILDKILESKDESLTDKFINKYLGADAPPAFSWGEVLKEIVQPLVPVIVQLVPLIFQQRPPATAANATVEVTAQPEAAPPVAQMPEATDTQKLLSITRNACLTNAPVTNTASAFDWLTTDANREQLQAIFSQSPEKVLEVLHIEVLTERVGWMAALQRELQDEEDAEPEVIQ